MLTAHVTETRMCLILSDRGWVGVCVSLWSLWRQGSSIAYPMLSVRRDTGICRRYISPLPLALRPYPSPVYL